MTKKNRCNIKQILKKILIISWSIFIVLTVDQDPYELKENSHELNLNLNDLESPIINQTVTVSRTFTAYWEYHIIWKDYRDQDHTAVGNFHLIGYNNTLNITVSTNQYVQYADVYIVNKHNSSSKVYYFSQVNVVVVHDCQDWTYQFWIEYSYTYSGCTDPDPPFCDEVGSMTVSGTHKSSFYDFFPKPSQPPAIPGYNMKIFISIVILGFILVLIIRKHQIKKTKLG